MATDRTERERESIYKYRERNQVLPAHYFCLFFFFSHTNLKRAKKITRRLRIFHTYFSFSVHTTLLNSKPHKYSFNMNEQA
jgi:hypothetical protein